MFGWFDADLINRYIIVQMDTSMILSILYGISSVPIFNQWLSKVSSHDRKHYEIIM